MLKKTPTSPPRRRDLTTSELAATAGGISPKPEPPDIAITDSSGLELISIQLIARR